MDSLKGHLLIAGENLLDPNFARTVVLVLEHGPHGAAGLVLNRPTAKTIHDVWKALFHQESSCHATIHLGGPVTGPLTALHGTESLGDTAIMPGLHATTDPEKLKKLVDVEPAPCKFFAGYSGWGAGQLENELADDSWLVIPARLEHVFWPGGEEVWSTVLSEAGYSSLFPHLSSRDIPDDPTVN